MIKLKITKIVYEIEDDKAVFEREIEAGPEEDFETFLKRALLEIREELREHHMELQANQIRSKF